MSTIADLVIRVRANTNDAEKDIGTFGSKVAGGFRKAMVPATVALGALGVAAKIGFDELKEGQAVSAQTAAVLKSTGGVANVTADHVDRLAGALLKKSGVDDEVIKSGENMLLTFTNIRNEAGKGNDVFDQTTKLMLDMSVALGQDTKSSALQLGKALNDPIKGITALQRVGVSFTQEQRDQIKTLVQHGKTMQAQKLILHELNREFGGSAAAAGKTFSGQMNIAKETAKNFAAELIQGALPTLMSLAGFLARATSFAEQHQTAVKILIGVVGGLSAGIVAVNIGMKLYSAASVVVRAATTAWTAAQWLLNAALAGNPIGIVVLALVALGAAIAVAWAKSETFRRIVTGAWNAIKTATMVTLGFIKDHWREALTALATIIGGPILGIVTLIATHWGTVKRVTVGTWNDIRDAVSGAVGDVKSAVSRVFNALDGIVSGAGHAIGKAVGVIKGAFDPIISVLHDIEHAAQTAADAIGRVVGAADKAGSIVGKVGGFLAHPHFATGVRNFSGGLAVVGEQGPELVNLPQGSDVFTNGESRRMLAGGQGAPLIGHATINNGVDIEVLAQRVARKLAFQS